MRIKGLDEVDSETVPVFVLENVHVQHQVDATFFCRPQVDQAVPVIAVPTGDEGLPGSGGPTWTHPPAAAQTNRSAGGSSEPNSKRSLR